MLELKTSLWHGAGGSATKSFMYGTDCRSVSGGARAPSWYHPIDHTNAAQNRTIMLEPPQFAQQRQQALQS